MSMDGATHLMDQPQKYKCTLTLFLLFSLKYYMSLTASLSLSLFDSIQVESN